MNTGVTSRRSAVVAKSCKQKGALLVALLVAGLKRRVVVLRAAIIVLAFASGGEKGKKSDG